VGPSSWPGLHALDYALLSSVSPPAPDGSAAPYFRLVHYPHAEEELEAADATGTLLWQESLSWGAAASTIVDPLFVAAQLQCIEEAVNASFNHPSAALFAFLNEGASDNRTACGTYEALAARYRSLRVNGLVTWASNRGTADLCLSAADVVAQNLYPAWYGFEAGQTVQEALDAVVPTIAAAAAWVAEHQPGKPFLLSEIGAGAIPGYHDAFGAQWSEEFQAALDGIVAAEVASNPAFAGTSIWQWSDGRTGDVGVRRRWWWGCVVGGGGGASWWWWWR
jgi:beta-glucuronidase